MLSWGCFSCQANLSYLRQLTRCTKVTCQVYFNWKWPKRKQLHFVAFISQNNTIKRNSQLLQYTSIFILLKNHLVRASNHFCDNWGLSKFSCFHFHFLWCLGFGRFKGEWKCSSRRSFPFSVHFEKSVTIAVLSWAGFTQGSNYEVQPCKFHLIATRAEESEGRGSHRARTSASERCSWKITRWRIWRQTEHTLQGTCCCCFVLLWWRSR